MSSGIDKRSRRLDRGRDDGCKFDRLLLQLDLAMRDPRDIQQIIDQANHLIDLPFHDFANGVQRRAEFAR